MIKKWYFWGTLVLIFATFLPFSSAQGAGNELLGRAFGGLGSGFIGTISTIFIGIIALGICVFILWWFVSKKVKWNMGVEFRIPRDIKEVDGEVRGTITKEWGKGFYNAKRGVCLVKRKGKKAVAMKPFDVKKFLSAQNILTVMQVGAEHYVPVFEESYLEAVDENNNEGALLNVKIDTSEGKAWKNSFERDAKSTYTIANFLTLHGDKLVWGLVVLIVLIGQAIVITRLG